MTVFHSAFSSCQSLAACFAAPPASPSACEGATYIILLCSLLRVRADVAETTTPGYFCQPLFIDDNAGERAHFSACARKEEEGEEVRYLVFSLAP